MKLYHGSNCRIEKINLAKSKPFKDFGKGFYLSDNKAKAMDMSNFKSLIYGRVDDETYGYFNITRKRGYGDVPPTGGDAQDLNTYLREPYYKHAPA